MEQTGRYDRAHLWDALASLGLQGIWLRAVYDEKGQFADGVRMALLAAANKLQDIEARLAAMEQRGR